MKFAIVKTAIYGRTSYQQLLEPHRRYLADLAEKRVLLGGGPYEDRSGGLLLVETNGLEEAVDIARRDPLVAGGVERYSVQAWTPLAGNLPSIAGAADPAAPPPGGGDAEDYGPIEPPASAEVSFRIIKASGHPDYLRLMVQCFAPNQISQTDPSRCSYLRRSEPRGLQKLLLLHEDEIAGQIEFASPSVAGLPVEGPGVTVINCIWVADAYTGLECGTRLLAACAERAGGESLAIVAFNATLPWLPRSFFQCHGFLSIDQAETGRFYGNKPIVAHLMWRPLRKEAKRPSWNKNKLLEGVDFCPAYPWLFGKRIYWGRDYDYHGFLVKEGLRRPEVLHQLPILGSQRTGNWTLVKFGVPESDINRAVELVQSALITEPTYYAHAFNTDTVLVIFPERVFRMSKSPSSWSEAVQYGIGRGIPVEELDFTPVRLEDERF